MLDRSTATAGQGCGADGRSLAYGLRGRGKLERAIVGALIAEGKLSFEQPTSEQTARLVGVSVSYIRRVRALTLEEREAALEAGCLPPSTADVARTVARAGVEPVWNALTRAL